MRIEFKKGSRGNKLVVVVFEPDYDNFNPSDLSWVPKKKELYEIYREMKQARAWG
ncbi:MAG: hypothetical protein JSV51_02740 [Candidatus Bathyarchaeota archaeon]|nr:MAG: hypothetical protein JSV51_02740 [Candidatus Bathyarchaeota archaeon]